MDQTTSKVWLEEKQSLEMHFFWLPELEACFMATGFSIEERYGSYNFEPLDEKASQIRRLANFAVEVALKRF